jgi:uncharacterized protein YcbK (DUF882 family)
MRHLPPLAFALALALPLPLAAQAALMPPVLGMEPGGGIVASDRTDAATGFGRSGAVRVLLAAPATRLDPGALGLADRGWQRGHRWVSAEAPAGPRVLGEPATPEPAPSPGYVADGLLPGEVTTPDRAGVWTLESASGPAHTVITLVPAAEARGGRLNGYRIGTYPAATSDLYAPPVWFIEVTPENRDLRVSEHLTLGQFLTKDQFDVWPKYLALDLRLVDKLELVIQELNAMGVPAERMHVMSGFRTPLYNGPGGGGRAALSRHMWGDAADVWIDSLGDEQMDDLNGDGRIDIDDAAVIMRAVERVERKFPDLVGGAGTYPSSSARGPYIHIDARGYRSRW